MIVGFRVSNSCSHGAIIVFGTCLWLESCAAMAVCMRLRNMDISYEVTRSFQNGASREARHCESSKCENDGGGMPLCTAILKKRRRHVSIME
jgi:hypothetical protein